MLFLFIRQWRHAIEGAVVKTSRSLIVAPLLIPVRCSQAQLTGAIEGMVTADPSGRCACRPDARGGNQHFERRTGGWRRAMRGGTGRLQLAPGRYRLEVDGGGL